MVYAILGRYVVVWCNCVVGLFSDVGGWIWDVTSWQFKMLWGGFEMLMGDFVVDQNKRGPHISLVICRPEIKVWSEKQKRVRVEANEIREIIESLGLMSDMTVFRQGCTLLDQGCPNFDENFFGAPVHEKIEI